jgi:hypothetical protein
VGLLVSQASVHPRVVLAVKAPVEVPVPVNKPILFRELCINSG